MIYAAYFKKYPGQVAGKIFNVGNRRDYERGGETSRHMAENVISDTSTRKRTDKRIIAGEDNGEKEKMSMAASAVKSALVPSKGKRGRAREKQGMCVNGDVLEKNASLSRCMLRLLESPASDCEEKNQLLASGFCEKEMNQTMLLAQAMLRKAVEKGDVSAYREVKALIDTETEGSGQLDKLLAGIREAIAFEQLKEQEKGPD